VKAFTDPHAINPDLPPHSRDVERDVIGSCFLHPRAYAEAAQFVDAKDFWVEGYRRLFEACRTMAERSGGNVALTGLRELLEAQPGATEERAGDDYLDAIEAIRQTADHTLVGYYARWVADYSLRRQLITAGGMVATGGYDLNAADALANAYLKLDAIRDGWHGGERLRMLVSEYTTEMLEGLDGKPEATAGVLTGLPRVDHLTGGLHPGEVTVLAARTGHGKTALACQIALEALHKGVRVVFATLEMAPLELLYRMLSMETGVEAGRLASGANLTDDEVSSAVHKIALLDDLGLSFIWRPAGLDLQTLDREAERATVVGECGLLIVDYLQLVRYGQRVDNRAVEVGEVAMGLKRLAQRLRVPILALAQLNRAVEMRADPHPILSDLRESGALEQAADGVYLLWRPALFGKNGQPAGETDNAAFLHVAKNRTGPTGHEPLLWDGPTTSFKPLSYREE